MKIAMYSFGAEYSQRLPHKNYKILYGKEVCRYTFYFIKELQKIFDFQYYVFTDSEIIKNIAAEYKFNIIWCTKEWRDGIVGNRRIHEIMKADKYFSFSFTSPIRDILNIKQNILICLKSDVKSAYSLNIKNPVKPIATGSMFFWTKEQLNQNDVRDYNSICLPDWYDFDIDTQKEFDRVEKYLKENK